MMDILAAVALTPVMIYIIVILFVTLRHYYGLYSLKLFVLSTGYGVYVDDYDRQLRIGLELSRPGVLKSTIDILTFKPLKVWER